MAAVVAYLFILAYVWQSTEGKTTPKVGPVSMCANDSECLAAYSECVQTTCKCMQNFTQVGDDTCKPANNGVYNCPYLDPLLVKGSVKLCNARASNECGKDYFCFAHEYSRNATKKNTPLVSPGHCCPVPPDEVKINLCPLGFPDPGRCTYGVDGPKCGDGKRRKCTGRTENDELACCPTACPSPYAINYWTVVDGTCLR